MPEVRIVGSYKENCPKTEERLDRLARLMLSKNAKPEKVKASK